LPASDAIDSAPRGAPPAGGRFRFALAAAPHSVLSDSFLD